MTANAATAPYLHAIGYPDRGTNLYVRGNDAASAYDTVVSHFATVPNDAAGSYAAVFSNYDISRYDGSRANQGR